MRRADLAAAVLVATIATLLWLPRRAGPIDLRWDAGVYYILGTSLAEGRGYRLLNEPGQIRAVQYPPLLPAIVAVHERLAGTADPTTVGTWLRRSAFAVFVVFALVVLWFLRTHLPTGDAVLAAVVPVLMVHAWFMSDAMTPELWFAVATLLFLIFARRRGAAQIAAYPCAVASYALRTVGLAAFVVWVLDSVVRRRLREALARAVLALIPLVCWQAYIASVEHSDAYVHPAYEYQRAPYLFYNVSYARNLALRDPSDPAKGKVRIIRRLLRNGLELPSDFGEVLTTSRGYVESALHAVAGGGPTTDRIVALAIFFVLWLLGFALVIGGIVVQMLRGDWHEPVYLIVYAAALCATPFPDQFLRYLMPVSPLVVLSAVTFLRSVSARPSPGRAIRAVPVVLVPAVLIQLAVVVHAYTREYEPIEYRDSRGVQVSYKVFFYGPAGRGFDEAVDYLQSHAHPPQIVAAGTPHWIYLRTGLQSVMTPFEQDPAKTEHLLEDVPVDFLIVGHDVIGSERFTEPALRNFPARWRRVFSSGTGGWTIYQRVAPTGACELTTC